MAHSRTSEVKETNVAPLDFTVVCGFPSKMKPIIVSAPDLNCLLEDLEERIANGLGFSLATLNLDHLTKIASDPNFRSAYSMHSHVTADGNPIVWLCRLAGQYVSLIPGSELIEPITEIAARQHLPVAMIGSNEASLKGAATVLGARYPGLCVVAKVSPTMDFDPYGPEATACISTLEASGARLCFLALGAPKQEIFAARAQRALPQVGFLSIGAGLDFISGYQRRAPKWIRRLAMEWLWRMFRNPRRLTIRYLRCIFVLPRAIFGSLQARNIPEFNRTGK